VKSLILGDFSAGCVLITYGVLLGKVSPLQMMLIATFETIFYTINELIALDMEITDIGGSMVIHMFGAFFGLSLSFVLQRNWIKEDLSNNASVYHSDMFAMIGTVFLWMFWPSFNGVLGADDEARHVAVVNTVLSLCGSCVAAFLFSNVFRGDKEFCMVDIQNATLAGGVAMGSSADLMINPGMAVFIGFLAGLVSVIGYVWVQPYLERAVGLHDTCGVNNLHGMPSIIGAVAGMISLATNGDDAEFPTGSQASYLFITLAISIFGGGLTGLIMRGVEPLPAQNLFQDRGTWEVPHEEFPYYFDHRGEVGRQDEEAGPKKDIAALRSRLAEMESRFSARKINPASNNGAAAGDKVSMELSTLEAMFTRILDARESKKIA
jgi:ammonium transporter Rh